MPYGYVSQRENVLSPSTLSLERHRLLWLYLTNETSFFSAPLKVLHFAPEQAFYNRFRKLKNLDYTTTDLNSPLADVKADICDLPFKAAEFDFILCNHVLEHIPDDRAALSEIHRVLRPGGLALIMVPIDRNRHETFEDPQIVSPSARHEAFGHPYHVRVCGWDYADRIRASGFDVREAHSTEMPEHKRRINGINKTVLYNCTT